MRKNILNALIAVAAMLVGVAMTGCGSSKQVTQAETEQSALDAEIARLEREKRLIEAQTELELAKRNQELRLAQTPEVVTTLEWHPCMQNSVGVSDDVLLGFGISDQSRDRTEALLNANAVAVADIAGRLVGVIKTGLERYADFGYTQSANRIDQSETENLAASIGEKAINKIGNVSCREIGTDDKTGLFVGYVSLQVSLQETMDEVTTELEKAGLRYDKTKFRDMMTSELERQNQQRNQEIEAMRQARGL